MPGPSADGPEGGSMGWGGSDIHIHIDFNMNIDIHIITHMNIANYITYYPLSILYGPIPIGYSLLIAWWLPFDLLLQGKGPPAKGGKGPPADEPEAAKGKGGPKGPPVKGGMWQ